MIRVHTAILAVLFVPLCAWSGDQLGVCPGEYHDEARALSGWVLYTNTGTPMSSVAVERWTAGWKKVIESTKTDEKGFFKLSAVPEGTYWLTTRRKDLGCDRIIVRVRKNSENKLLSLITEAERSRQGKQALVRRGQRPVSASDDLVTVKEDLS